MKTISQSALKKLVQEKNLTISRGKIPKSKPKESEKKPAEIKPDLTSGVVIKSAEIVSSMASTMADAADKMAEQSVIVAQTTQSIQKSLKEKPAIVEKPKKRKWKFTPHRDYDRIIQYITVEEL